MVLEAVYEQSFLDCSYGFRPGRSAHQALRVVQHQTVVMAGKWVLEVDLRNFFGTLDHSLLRDVVRKRVRDGVLLRLIGKWLNAGVMEDGAIQYPEAGTPQGGVIPQSSRTSTCTRRLMSGLRGRSGLGLPAVRLSPVMLMTWSSSLNTNGTRGESSTYCRSD